MRETTTQTEITATFQDSANAEAAAQALIEAGVLAASIEIALGVRGRESAFLWRLILIIVLWSILGGVIGALIGVGLAATIGPDGSAGLVFQVICWTLIGHLVAGMIAGYWLLADRTQRELAPGGVVAIVTVRVDPERSQEAQRMLLASGAEDVCAPRSRALKVAANR